MGAVSYERIGPLKIDGVCNQFSTVTLQVVVGTERKSPRLGKHRGKHTLLDHVMRRVQSAWLKSEPRVGQLRLLTSTSSTASSSISPFAYRPTQRNLHNVYLCKPAHSPNLRPRDIFQAKHYTAYHHATPEET